MRRGEFILLIASLMSITAFAIDIILPAFNEISVYYGLDHDNQRQGIISYYLMGLGIAQLLFGPLSDRYGRKPVLLFSLGLYFALAIYSALTTSFSSFLLARFLQGLASGGPSVIAVALIRDRYRGKFMARVTSIAVSIFITVPIFAPLLGQLLLFIMPWRYLFYLLALYSLGIIIWVSYRMSESAPLQVEVKGLLMSSLIRYGQVLSHASSVMLLCASGILVGLMFSYLSAAQQVFVNTYQTGNLFPLYFAVIAFSIVLSSLINARIVIRFGTVRIIENAILVMLVVTCCDYFFSLWHEPNLYEYLFFQFLIIFTLGFLRPNLLARAMEKLGAIAGTASAFGGFVVNFGGATIGYIVAQQYDGTNLSLASGNVIVVLASLALLYIHRLKSKRDERLLGIKRH